MFFVLQQNFIGSVLAPEYRRHTPAFTPRLKNREIRLAVYRMSVVWMYKVVHHERVLPSCRTLDDPSCRTTIYLVPSVHEIFWDFF